MQTENGNRENVSCVGNRIFECWIHVQCSWTVKANFSDVILRGKVVSLIGLSRRGESLSSLHLAFLNRRYITVLLTGTLRQHLLGNV